MDTVEANFEAVLNDFVKAGILARPKKKRFGRRFWMWVICSMALIIGLMFWDDRLQQVSLPLRFAPAFILFSFIVLLELASDEPSKRYIEKMAKQIGGLDVQHGFVMDQKGIGHGWAGYRASFGWEQLGGLSISADMLVFSVKMGNIVFVPTRVLSLEQIALVKSQAVAHQLSVEDRAG
jgi:hypothetical protein